MNSQNKTFRLASAISSPVLVPFETHLQNTILYLMYSIDVFATKNHWNSVSFFYYYAINVDETFSKLLI